ncbi:DUF2949 domain-containing protein [Geitlerinema sp. PCC 7407]|uniref:DUF2949 domain-containing protein n=1 Tax=Geitlerinema sp. PCC 7407 TaxID=1173025 RepID=UPI00029F8BBD|nr:DUF2949 domain-containing protein [Geitlerinema sp. PCC 7407]AFY64518.1 hypothetical protein GEI7407_0012 [Geitlerinema sp. PCC 7407]
MIDLQSRDQLNLLIGFLRYELALPEASIAMALRQAERSPHLLPFVLWQYGLVSLDQLEATLDWLETCQPVL